MASRKGVRRGAVAGAVALGLGLALLTGGGDATPSPAPVAREDLVIGVSVEGELQPVRRVSLGPPALAEFQMKISYLAPESASVGKGEPLMRFDPQDVVRQLEQVRADLASVEADIRRSSLDLEVQLIDLEQRIAQAESDRDKARLQAEVPEELVARVEAKKARLELVGKERALENLVAERESALARSDAALGSLEARRRQALARLHKLESALEQMAVEAPQDGVVVYETMWGREKKKVGDTVWFGETILSLPDLSEMKAVGMIEEADAGQVAVGQPVSLRLEARPDVDLEGQVTSLGQTVRRRSWRVPAKVFRVEIALSRSDPSFMKPAMRFRGEIEVERLADRLTVPREAVFRRASGPVVFARRWWRWAETPVRLGRQSDTRVEVVAGLREGEGVLPVDLDLSGQPDRQPELRR